eukprot:SM000115S23910  [mRNA]  locus=s115:137479:138945:+ [translate_table: standard]
MRKNIYQRMWLLIYNFVRGGNLESYLRDSSSSVTSHAGSSEAASLERGHTGPPHTVAESGAENVCMADSGDVRIKSSVSGLDPNEQERRQRRQPQGDSYSHTAAALQAGHTIQQIAAPQLIIPEESAEQTWQEILAALKVGLICTAREPSARPTMAEVIHLLDSHPLSGISGLSTDWQLNSSVTSKSETQSFSSLTSMSSSSYSIPSAHSLPQSSGGMSSDIAPDSAHHSM